MALSNIAPWLVLIGYAGLIWTLAPRSVDAAQFFSGGSRDGGEPGLWLLAASAAITWIFAKSISNAANLGAAFGPWGASVTGFTICASWLSASPSI
jgi:SSS family solute:Na+ symporter